MNTFTVKARLKVVVKTLRFLSQYAESISKPQHIRELLESLDDVRTLLCMCLYEHQKQLIQNVAHEYDATEIS